MKISVLLVVLFFPIVTYCQTYNTKITRPKKNVIIDNGKGGKVELVNPTVVIIYQSKGNKQEAKANVIIDTSVTDQKIYVVDYKQQADSTGLYITTIEFGNVGQKMATDVFLHVRFDKKFEDVNWNILSPVSFSVTESYDNDKMGAIFSAGMMTAGRKCVLTIRSKEKIYATITGANGAR